MSLYLSANRIVSDFGTIGDYLVQWRSGSTTGSSVFISGEGTDPLLQAIHPFTNEVVQSGTLYPVIIYADFNGQRYTLESGQGENYSPDLLNCLELNYIQIDAVDCASGAAGTYSHTFNYTNTIDPAVNANRTIRFNLDITNDFVAWKFIGYSVMDQIKISYVSALDPNNPTTCSYWRVGQATNDFTSSPKVLGSYPNSNHTMYQVINLRNFYAFNIGDYLLIEIVPRVIAPTNVNTNWNLSLKCLSTFADYTPPVNSRTLDVTSPRIVWNSSTCNYEIYYKFVNRYVLPTHFANYLQFYYYSSLYSNVYYSAGTEEFYARFPNSKGVTATGIAGTASCFDGGGINYTKVGNVVTITVTTQVDYDRFKAAYDATIVNANWTNWTADDTDINHFKFWNFVIPSAVSCGDTTTYLYYYIYYSSVFVLDDVNRQITVTLVDWTNNLYAEPTCDSTYSGIESIRWYTNNLLNAADFNITSPSVQNNTIVSSNYYKKVTTATYTQSHWTGPFVTGTVNPDFCEMFVPTGWAGYNTSQHGYVTGDRVLSITNPDDILNNFRIDNWQDPTTGLRRTYIDLEYEKINGVSYSTFSRGMVANIVSAVGWTGLTVSALSTNDFTTYGYTFSTSYVSAIFNSFGFNVPTGKTIDYIGFEAYVGSGGANHSFNFKYRISKDNGATWSNYSDERTFTVITSSFNLDRLYMTSPFLGLSITPEEINSPDFCVEFSARSLAGNTSRLSYFNVNIYYL